MAILFGVPLSGFVRKVMLAHAYKGVGYELNPVSPRSDDPIFLAASPLKKIPAYKTDKGTCFSDSSVIIAYLDKSSPEKSLYPEEAELYAKALWLEEYGDTKMSEAVSVLYYERVIGPAFFNHVTNEDKINGAIAELLPPVFDFIEGQLTTDEWAVNNVFSIADLTIGMNLINLYLAKFEINAVNWPKLAGFNKRFMALDIVQEQLNKEKALAES